MKLVIIPFGEIKSDLLDFLSQAIKKTFGCYCRIEESISVPKDTFNKSRRQYNSTAILKKLASQKMDRSVITLGIIDEDLYASNLNFVFGEADLLNRVAIISLWRLRPEFYRLPTDERLLYERAMKEAIHEIGHVYGLGHCHNPKCIMYFSNSIKDTDRKGPDFCNLCAHELRILKSENV